jgi:manganese oxidase
MDMQGDISPNANSVPGFPQDAYMEGPMMNMDKMVEKPENYGLRPGWTEDMQGMMTLIRVLPPAQYDEMMARIQRNKQQAMPDMPGMSHGA